MRDRRRARLLVEKFASQPPSRTVLGGDAAPAAYLFKNADAGIQHIYIQSFVSLATDWSVRRTWTESTPTVADLRRWWTELDEEFERVIGVYSDEELNTRTIDRGPWTPTAFVQFQIYREAVLIFLAKASIYLKAMQKPLSPQWRVQIG